MKKTVLRYFSIKNICVFIGLALFAIVIPNTMNPYAMTVVNSALGYFIGALGISLMLGMGGQMSFATISFMGVGAFTTVQFSKTFGMNTVLAMLLSTLIVMALSGLLGLILFRLSGAYFTFATIGLVQIIFNILVAYKPFSGGGDGITGIPKLSFLGITFNNLYTWFYLFLAVSVTCGLIVERIRHSALGRSLASIRDNEIAAQTLGVDVYRVKIIAFIIAGGFAGISGSLIAYHNASISAFLFSYNTSTTLVVMVMLGGVNSTTGTFLGSLLVTMLPEWLRFLDKYLRFIYGIGIILLMIFMPQGLAGIYGALKSKLRRRLTGKAVQKEHANS